MHEYIKALQELRGVIRNNRAFEEYIEREIKILKELEQYRKLNEVIM